MSILTAAGQGGFVTALVLLLRWTLTQRTGPAVDKRIAVTKIQITGFGLFSTHGRVTHTQSGIPENDAILSNGIREMDILVLLIVTVVVAGGGLWMVSRDSRPVEPPDEHHPG